MAISTTTEKSESLERRSSHVKAHTPFSIRLLGRSATCATQSNDSQSNDSRSDDSRSIDARSINSRECEAQSVDSEESGMRARSHNRQLLSLMPASYVTEDDYLTPISFDVNSLKVDLDVEELNEIFSYLHFAGQPVPPDALHHQLLLNRDIFITEEMAVHLVWTTGRIFLKPIPRFLLEPRAWAEHLSCKEDCICSQYSHSGSQGKPQYCERRKLHRCALGFLFSYTSLIRHESDFLIAKEKHLLPEEVEWPAWRIFVEELDTESIYPKIDRRFLYGELKLSRLDKITAFARRPYLRRYAGLDRNRGVYRKNWTWLASATVFIAVILTAMQVGLATKGLGDNSTFQSASYGFTVFSIVAPLAAAVINILVFGFASLHGNWWVGARYTRKRLHALEQECLEPEA
ncbi:Fc.00g096940.m01.CDS01 [Cosmosporella sp. VM-42]